MVHALRTPDDRFAGLPGYDFDPHYVGDLPGYGDLRMHYVDVGPPRAARVFLCLHGQPTWAYLYRKMIPVFTAAGHRVVAPDLYGFGRSDKPMDEAVYGFAFHRTALIRLIERLRLKHITLVCQDWGGLLGLTIPMDMPGGMDGPGPIDRMIVMNTGLGTGDKPLGDGFLAWRAWCSANPDMDVARLMARACPHLTPAECAAYAAPFPDIRSKAGVRRFPDLVPDNPNAEGAALSRRAREWLKTEWTGRTFMAVGMQDPVLGPKPMAYLRKQIRGCPKPLEVAEGGHFLQEWGADVARAALEAFG